METIFNTIETAYPANWVRDGQTIKIVGAEEGEDYSVDVADGQFEIRFTGGRFTLDTVEQVVQAMKALHQADNQE